MDQDRIGKIIKKIREDNKLTQKELADELGVTFQAVSKWENGKNIPDVAILKDICEKYNYDMNDIMGTKGKKSKLDKKYVVILYVTFILVFATLIISFKYFKSGDFKFETLESKCGDFNIYGSIAYNSNKLSMYISNINYCGKEDNNQYTGVECILYEKDDENMNLIDKYSNKYDEGRTIEDILNDINFNVADHEKVCKSFNGDNLFLEINATFANGEVKTYTIPLTAKETCENDK